MDHMMSIHHIHIKIMNIYDIPIKRFVIIGSFPLGIRDSKDIDIICYKKNVETKWLEKDNFSGHFDFQERRIELLFADEQESFQYLLDRYSEKTICPIHNLHAIKRGHIMFPNKNWEKHMNDLGVLNRLMNYSGAIINNELIKLHKKSTEFRLGKQKLPKLKGVTKEEFFDDNVTKFFDHDDIHRLFAHKEFPMYEYMQRDKTKVQCDKDLWDKFSYKDKLHCVTEESYVIASERILIPTLKGISLFTDTHEAFKWALMRVCTTLCSGWFRDFAIDNYFQVLNSYNHEYYKKLEKLK